eukprot:scaffold13328_cov112-Isochrysis_galbana.AAC.3
MSRRASTAHPLVCSLQQQAPHHVRHERLSMSALALEGARQQQQHVRAEQAAPQLPPLHRRPAADRLLRAPRARLQNTRHSCAGRPRIATPPAGLLAVPDMFTGHMAAPARMKQACHRRTDANASRTAPRTFERASTSHTHRGIGSRSLPTTPCWPLRAGSRRTLMGTAHPVPQRTAPR